MPRSARKNVLKNPVQQPKDDSQVNELRGLKASKGHGLEVALSHVHDLRRSKQPLATLRNKLNGKLKQIRVAGKLPEKARLKPFSAGTVRTQKAPVGKLLKQETFFMKKKICTSGMVAEMPSHGLHSESGFLSILLNRGRLVKEKVAARLMGRTRIVGEEPHRFPHAKELQLFRALREQPLTFAELHNRFGVSRQTARRLVNRGLFIEAWGPNAVGMRFRLSRKGRVRLEELESATKYETRTRERDLIRLKSRRII